MTSEHVHPETVEIIAPMAATVSSIDAEPGGVVRPGTAAVVLEVMKMEHPIGFDRTVRVERLDVAVGDTVEAGQRLAVGRPVDEDLASGTGSVGAAVGGDRGDVRLLRAHRQRLEDTARPEAVARRHERGQRTARENVADLVDPGSFREYGGFAFAAQERRRSREDLDANTPADGLITGIGRVNSDLVGADRAACVILAYDYTVLAGTQGYRNHHKKDRILEIAARLRLPVVLFAEGGGGRPGDTDAPMVAGLDARAFQLLAALSGEVPSVGIASGRCFAGNAALLGCCDVVIATEDANIGMGGPAMIEGGGLGVHAPEDIGSIDVQHGNGVVDVRVADEAEAVEAAKHYLAFFQGHVEAVDPPVDIELAELVPEHRKTVYPVREAIRGITDAGSALELRDGFGRAVVTVLARLRGRTVGIVANDPEVNGGAIDADAADKAARFLQLCDAHGFPILSLCDTPGFMVGPTAEETAQVRRFSRLFVTGASLTVPMVTVVLRKAYGLGAMAMAGGGFHVPVATLSWPTGEFGGMGLEGAVRLGFRAELEAIEDPDERTRAFDDMVDAAYRHGRALNVAAHLEIDDVIEADETRDRVADLFLAHHRSVTLPARRRSIDPW